MKRFKPWTSLLVALTLAAGSVAAHADSMLDRVKQRGELVVGTEMQFAPFDFLENGQQAGFNKDLFAAVGQIVGVKVRFVDLPWESVLPGLDAGKFDMVAGPLTVTKARMERYAFSLPIAEATDALLKRASDGSLKISADIAGKVVGAGKGSAQLEQLKSYAATLPKPPTIREYVDNNQAYADLAAGRLAAVANSLTNVAYVAKQRPAVFSVVQPAFGTKVYFAYALRKDADSTSLASAFNGALVTLDKNGTLATLQRKWFGVATALPAEMPTPNY
ncbi:MULTISPECIES: transporter substrate-binding domain-containing protein [unclassified Burkholderia]|uniref:transporter substrate-binding domain-containing protein n=1 Tax=unclassified Burkholderia TaxID=2613784 RepID=UPI000F5884AA|nr:MULTISPECIES: transporter substrate-binding domain-containing protein [unclassified Burkholderia]RQR46742.1 amino acid ABC transporter [Burkholderia sp. Bp9131]RQR79628.1 amino acid ABC transporter [Burkholderia sp. Bp9015]RQR90246.1 amino acid ABC transporter [Burkholderia sp. Bp9011]RQR99254.1 amino acid ABC transporter [Burkholderia sp. Bp9010]RQS01947.1 amino acid ABC transporter [Burkholderia sp. Bp8994]